jgi:hypothetical protein
VRRIALSVKNILVIAQNRGFKLKEINIIIPTGAAIESGALATKSKISTVLTITINTE